MGLTDADRDGLLEWLAAHAAEGTIDSADHERRVELVLRAATREAAQEALAGLPAPRDRRSAPAPIRRGRGHGEADGPEPDWHATGERFRDPRSGRVMRVWIDSGGGRHYLAEPPEDPIRQR